VAIGKICIVGAGAVGGTIGAQLAAAGYPTSALARGRTLAALRDHGWRHRDPDGVVITAPVSADDDPARLAAPDVLVLAVKAPSLPGLADRLGVLIGPGTVVVPAMNGVPWWFFHGLGGSYDGLPLRSVDPAGSIAAAIPPAQVVGCVVHFSAAAVEPGVTVRRAGAGLIIGEPGGGGSERVAELAAVLDEAGFAATVSDRIQRDVWYKLWGNMTMNPISALTGATTDRILDDDLVAGFVRSVMVEAAAIGDRIGCSVPQSPADRNALTRKLGAMRTSMLADAEAGRPLELDAMLTAVAEVGNRVGVPVPQLRTLLGLSRLAARVRGLYPAASPAS
jgi:2-dehydropantoate 2-reductase